MLLQVGILIVLSGFQGSAGQWSYKNPEDWGKTWPTCDGNQQSPIDLPVNLYEVASSLDQSVLKFNEYNRIPKTLEATNNGHTIHISGTWPDESKRPYISGGPLNGQYVFEQFHFHWGSNDSVGSEHTFNGRRSALELHIVHYKRDYGNLSAATGYPDGVAVVAALYDSSIGERTLGIKKVWKDLKSVEKDGSSIQLKPFALSDFEVVQFGDIFASYFGSLTTPGCSEAVTWLIALDLFSITQKELHQIRQVELHEGDKNNWRPLQERNDRNITFYSSSS